MTFDETTIHGPNDPFGFRWDGAQFAIDTARPGDRIALVIFRGNAAVATRALDPSGFVKIGRDDTGKAARLALKQLVDTIRELESAEAQAMPGARAQELATGLSYLPQELPNQLSSWLRERGLINEGNQLLWHGTSCVEALRTTLGLLPARDETGRKTRVLLFTDGEEQPPDGPAKTGLSAEVFGKKYDYMGKIDEFRTSRGRALGELNRLMLDYQRRATPVYTFGLGENIDREFLQAVSERSRADVMGEDDERALAACYTPKTGEDLFRVIREVVWELRRYWFWTASIDSKAPPPFLLSTPTIGFGHDLGLSVYLKQVDSMDLGLFRDPKAPTTALPTRRTIAKVEVTRAPRSKPLLTMSARSSKDVPKFPIDTAPWSSRSHQYFDLSTSQDGGAVPMGGIVFVEYTSAIGPDEVFECVAAARTNVELFAYDAPRQNSTYTPKDAIPIRVRFRPPTAADGGPRFVASDFVIDARFQSAGKTDRHVEVRLDPPQVAGDPSTTFSGSLQLDPEPGSSGNPRFAGIYAVDITITAKSGPLQGASRRLIRRSLTVEDYPKLSIQPGRVILSNDDPKNLAVEADVSFDRMTTDPAHAIAALTAEIVPHSGAGPGKSLGPERFRVTVLPGPTSRTPRVRVEMSGEEWTKLDLGEYEGGRLRVSAPWGQSAEAPVVVRRFASTLATTPPRLALAFSSRSTKETGRREVRLVASLSQGAPIVELARLIDSSPGATEGRIVFDRDGGGEPIRLRVLGLNREVKVRMGEPGPDEGWKFEFEPEGPLPSGTYRHDLKIQGRSVRETTVPIEVQVDSPRVYLGRRDGDPTPIDDLTVPGLAGMHLRRSLLVSSESKQAIGGLKVQTVRLKHAERDAFDGLDLAPRLVKDAGEQGEVAVDLPIPACVRPGRYEGELWLSGTLRAGQAFLISVPIHLDVAHRGVRVEKDGRPIDGPLRVAASPGGGVATATFDLAADPGVGTSPIRWAAQRQPSPTPVPGTTALDRRERVDLRFGNNSVVTAGNPRDTVAKGRPCPITLTFDANGLRPGLYCETFRFVSVDDEDKTDAPDPVASTELNIVLLVPGRVIRAFGEAPPAREIVAGSALPLRVSVDAFGCPVGLGTLQPILAPGVINGGPIELVRAPSVEDKSFPKDLTHHEFVAKVTPVHSGPNRYEVRWPKLDTTEAEPELRLGTTIDARGKIEIRPTAEITRPGKTETDLGPPLIYVGEEVMIKVAVDSEAAGKLGTLRLRQNCSGSAEPLALTYDSENQAFTTRTTIFDKLGIWQVEPIDPEASLRLAPATVEVGFKLLPPEVELGSITHGGGSLLGWKWNHEKLPIPLFLEIENDRTSPCSFGVEIRHAESHGETEKLRSGQTDVQVASLGDSMRVDQDRYLVARLVGGDGPGSDDVKGTIPRGGTRTYSLVLSLPEAATNYLYHHHDKGAEPQVLQGSQGMRVGLTIAWDDGRQRSFYFPTIVDSRSDKFVATIFQVILALVLIAPLAYFGWRFRHILSRSPRSSRRDAESDEDPMASYDRESSPEPTSRKTRPRRASRTRSAEPTDDVDDASSGHRDVVDEELHDFFRDDH